MRKVILLVVLVIGSNSAFARWVEIGSNDALISYANPATIRKSGSKVKMWSVFDYKTAQGSDRPYISAKALDEYDCKEEQTRTLSLSLHSENMGNGDVVSVITDTSQWMPVSPDSIGEIHWKFACKKR